MPLSVDHYDKLLLHAQIIHDRSQAIEIALNGDVRDDALDAIADQSLDILDAAQAIVILCARVARGARHTTPATAHDPITTGQAPV